MIVPDKFNMVDMEGIDLLFSYGDIIPGLYQKLVESITPCRYQCLYNWYFDGVLIPPTYVEMVVNQDTDDIWINNGVFVTSDDRVSLHLPSLETASGSIVYITDALSRRVEELICYINPLQAGSGDPSPDNIRPISGYLGVNIFDEIEYDLSAEPKASVNWQNEAGTVYGASLTINDDGSGKIICSSAKVKVSDLSWSYSAGGVANVIYTIIDAKENGDSNSILCDTFSPLTQNAISISNAKNLLTSDNTCIASINTSAPYIYVRADSVSTSQEFIATYANTEFIYKLSEPITYNLTNLQVLELLLGENSIWHDANGDISVTYWKE